MKKLSLLFVVIIATSLIIASCGKYEEGPSISLRSKTARITGAWKQVAINDSTITSHTITTINKDGSLNMGDGTYLMNGAWAFTNNKTGIITSYVFAIGGVDTTYLDTMTILRLTNKQLWTQDPSDEDENIFKAEKQ